MRLLRANWQKRNSAAWQADKRTLLRRVSFDITGLPPTAKAVDDFEQDNAPDAYKKMVEGLLNSKEFGQRWGRYG